MTAANTAELQALNFSELRVGMKLPGNIYNSNGRVLKRAGSVLEQDHLELLANYQLMVDGDWPQSKASTEPAPEVSRVITQMESQGKPGKQAPANQRAAKVKAELSEEDKRRFKRHVWRCGLRLIIQERQDGQMVANTTEVISNDISRAGFSFLIGRKVAVGSFVHVRFNELPGNPQIKGVVRNCVPTKSNTYRIGVEFVATSRG